MRTKSRKALSPVVASIILIAVTVAVSIAVAAWMGALTFGFMGSSSITVTNVVFADVNGVANQGSGATTNMIILSLKNTGTKQVTIGQVKVNNNIYNYTIAAPINAGSISSLNITAVQWTNGNPYKIDLYDGSGNGVGSTQQNAPGA
ncbi:MAG: archaellin/type IV pilin N-terminal domain-containing protein [Candidatus Bathyarchaeia archaeon]